MRRSTDWLAYAGLRAALGALGPLSRPMALAAGAGMGILARDLFRLRRRVASRNLTLAFPDLPAGEREAIARRMYAHFGRMVVDTLRAAAHGPSHVARLIAEVDDAGLVERVLLGGRGVLLLTGHLGNWEFGAAYLAARGVPVSAVIKAPANRRVAAHLDRVRRRLGYETIGIAEARERVPAALREGRVVALVADQAVLGGRTWVSFFGRPTKTAEGPGLFAARCGAPVVFASCTARAGGGYAVAVEMLEESPRGAAREVVPAIATRYRQRLEAAVRRSPEQYLWTHRLWRRPPPGPAGSPAAP